MPQQRFALQQQLQQEAQQPLFFSPSFVIELSFFSVFGPHRHLKRNKSKMPNSGSKPQRKGMFLQSSTIQLGMSRI
jgi:hypothetical protein